MMEVICKGRTGLEGSNHTYKCMMKASLCFSNALFHIFSGPLFANVEGYVYLDLIIWGLSPLVFLVMRGYLMRYLGRGSNLMRPNTFKVLIVCILLLSVSYPFLNYSQNFNWNYFSRTFNLDMGYFAFDFLLRFLDLIIDLEDQTDTECSNYCHYQFFANTFAYFWVFILCSAFDVNDRNNGSIIFALSCFISFLSILCLPVVYYSKHKQYISGNYYDSIEPEEDFTDFIEDEPEELAGKERSTIRRALGVLLITSSLLLNTNYFSLWMMEPLGTTSESPSQQYNITVQMVSCFFLLSSLGLYISYQIFKSFPRISYYLFKLLLLLYGIGFISSYWNYHVNYVSLLILGFGIHQVCVVEFRDILQSSWNFGFQFSLYNEVFIYFILPLLFSTLNIGQKSLNTYALVSGVFLGAGALLI